MPRMRDWVRLPTSWIQAGGLKNFRWKQGEGADNIAALIVLMVLAHHAEDEDGTAKLSYDAIQKMTTLSRAKVSRGLQVLEERGIVARLSARSSYELLGYDRSQGWGKLPARKLYANENVVALRDFHLRAIAELDALKLYLLFIALRDNESNLARISYDKISDYSGIDRARIKAGLSLLVVNGLVHVERGPSAMSEYGVSNAYRLAHLDPYNHSGTRGRRAEELEESIF